MSDQDHALFPVPEARKHSTRITAAQYEALYRQSIEEPEAFWRKQAERLNWIEPFTEISDV